MVCPLVIKKVWMFKANDFYELVKLVKEIDAKIKRLEELTERHTNQIENAFNLFSKEGEHY